MGTVSCAGAGKVIAGGLLQKHLEAILASPYRMVPVELFCVKSVSTGSHLVNFETEDFLDFHLKSQRTTLEAITVHASCDSDNFVSHIGLFVKEILHYLQVHDSSIFSHHATRFFSVMIRLTSSFLYFRRFYLLIV